MGSSSSCQKMEEAFRECRRRLHAGACDHIGRALAICLLSQACPSESEAVRALCSSAGTSLKRSQCQQAQISLSLCISNHQNPTP
ncbi:hypothetical protein AMTRI_Chr02g213350 [Amborella trichopoda]